MATQNDGPVVMFIAGETITQWALVKLESDGYLDECDGTADADTNVIGVAQEGGASGDPIPVRMLNCVATCKVIADLDDLAVGDWLYTAAGGEVTDSNLSGSCVGIAMEASDTAGDIIEMCVNVQGVYNLT